MKILALLSSDTRGGDADIPQRDLFPARMAPMLAERLGEPIDVVARAIWPTPKLPGLVREWMAEEEPDLVMFSVQAYWFLYESMPVQMRRFGAPGQLLSAVVLKAAATPWLAHNAVFRAARRALRRSVPGRPHVTPEEVIAIATRSIGATLQREGAYVVVIGPAGGYEWATGPAARKRMEQRRKLVDDAVAEFCGTRHIEYWSPQMLAPMAATRRSLQGDGIHLDAEGHKQAARNYLDFSADLCERARAHNSAADASTQSEPAVAR